ncbi:MAG TPA: hypothetical protein PK915_00740, partial [Bacteroidales bacterium]|nr:hypothetical protein [Bacteroidales bacterium]
MDIANSGTIVTLTAFPIAPCTVPATKNVTLSIQQLPKILSFGPNTDFACSDSYLQLNADVQEYTQLSWSRIGDGTFSATNIPNPKYYPGPNDLTNGYFTLTLYAAPKTYCSTGTSESKTIEIIDNPSVEILTISGQHVCSYPPFEIQAIAESYQEILWTSNGDGSFANPNELITAYTPGQNDVSTGSDIELTVLASPIAPCEIAAEASVLVSFQSTPSANAGENATICEGSTLQLNGT